MDRGGLAVFLAVGTLDTSVGLHQDTAEGIALDPLSAAALHQAFLAGSPESRPLAECALVAESATRALMDRMKCAAAERRQMPGDQCPRRRPACQPDGRYRTADGSCNNLRRPTWGAALQPYRRLLRPDYGDGISSPRKTSTGAELVSARLVSTLLYGGPASSKSNCTLLFMVWGLFLDHDLTNTAVGQGPDGEAIACCDPRLEEDPTLRHPDCFPIPIPATDPFFQRFNRTCMEFVRSSPASSTLGPREQLNQVTAFLDGSAIYGSSARHTDQLRAFHGGFLKSSLLNGTEMLPQVRDASSSCGRPLLQQFCFSAGDVRANEQVDLTAMHGLWLREHNRLAALLQQINPHWTDERLFQETRRLVAAELQQITYAEYLPLLLGDKVIRLHGLALLPGGHSKDYDPDMDPTISNVFAASAFRFGHSEIQDNIELPLSGLGPVLSIPLHETFFNPASLYSYGLGSHVRGMLSQPSRPVGSHASAEIRDRLFQPRGRPYGLDLSAIGVQRARDHGLSGYPKWRVLCGLDNVSDWSDLAEIIGSDRAHVFRRLYRSVEDVDVTPAALAESPSVGSQLGDTHSCLVAEQFSRLKRGDRFWFETGDQPGSFSERQLQEIRKVTVARVLCDNLKTLRTIQPSAFRTLGLGNDAVPCSQLPHLDIAAWRDDSTLQ